LAGLSAMFAPSCLPAATLWATEAVQRKQGMLEPSKNPCKTFMGTAGLEPATSRV
jgi:hypothetical protein